MPGRASIEAITPSMGATRRSPPVDNDVRNAVRCATRLATRLRCVSTSARDTTPARPSSRARSARACVSSESTRAASAALDARSLPEPLGVRRSNT